MTDKHYSTQVADEDDWIQRREQTWGQLMPSDSRQQELNSDQVLRHHSQLTLGQTV